MNDSLRDQLRYLRLNRLLAHWDEDLKEAARARMSHATFLTYLIEQECRVKRDNARLKRLKAAGLPEIWTLDTYPFARQPKLNRKAIQVLYDTMDFIPKHQNIVWLGKSGCGKTGLATSFLVQAIHQGARGRYVTFAQMVAELYRSVAVCGEKEALAKYLAPDILLIDELGYIQLEPVQVGLFFTLMQQRHKKKSTLITSNLGFKDWASFLKNDHLTLALIDRLTEASHVFNMKDCTTLRCPLTPDP
jgi:DNA replication protein DnaC